MIADVSPAEPPTTPKNSSRADVATPSNFIRPSGVAAVTASTWALISGSVSWPE